MVERIIKRITSSIDYAILLYCDNQSTIRFGENSIFHARTKNVEVHYHSTREKVLQEEVECNM